MSADPSLHALSSEQARRLRALRRTLGLGVVMALVVGLLWAHFQQLGDRGERAARRGAVALRAAVEGDPLAFDRAEDAFEDAARGSLFGAYPIFALALIRGLRAGQIPEVNPALRPAVEALARGDLDAAGDALALASRAEGRAWLARLIREMRSPDATDGGGTRGARDSKEGSGD